MAAKKRVSRATAIPATNGQDDIRFVDEAYGAAVRGLVDTFFSNCITGDPSPEAKFLKGLEVIRHARDQARELVQR